MTYPNREQWSSRGAFILAATGTAVGLGNIWRFPFLAGENGGGAFVLLYLGFVLALGVPALMATVMVGRVGGGDPVHAITSLAVRAGRSRHIGLLGWASIITTFLLLTYYSVVASWALAHLPSAILGFPEIENAQPGYVFRQLLADPIQMSLWHALFLGLVVFVVSLGVKRGIERAVVFLVPGLFLILGVLAFHSLVWGDVGSAISFLFKPDWSKLSRDVVHLALAQALFTLSVGGAGMIVYGAYLPKHVSIPFSVAVVATLDTLVAMLAGLIIFPILFAYDMSPDQGPSLMFVTLPMAFTQMTGGTILGVMFFLLLVAVSWSTAIAMCEPVVARLNIRFGIGRRKSSYIVGAMAWLMGLPSILAHNIWAEFRPVQTISRFADMNIFQLTDDLVANLLLPICALGVVLVSGWLISPRIIRREFGLQSRASTIVFLWVIRFFVPAALAGILIANLI